MIKSHILEQARSARHKATIGPVDAVKIAEILGIPCRQINWKPSNPVAATLMAYDTVTEILYGAELTPQERNYFVACELGKLLLDREHALSAHCSPSLRNFGLFSSKEADADAFARALIVDPDELRQEMESRDLDGLSLSYNLPRTKLAQSMGEVFQPPNKDSL